MTGKWREGQSRLQKQKAIVPTKSWVGVLVKILCFLEVMTTEEKKTRPAFVSATRLSYGRSQNLRACSEFDSR
jgi:hypothetical protein